MAPVSWVVVWQQTPSVTQARPLHRTAQLQPQEAPPAPVDHTADSAVATVQIRPTAPLRIQHNWAAVGLAQQRQASEEMAGVGSSSTPLCAKYLQAAP